MFKTLHTELILPNSESERSLSAVTRWLLQAPRILLSEKYAVADLSIGGCVDVDDDGNVECPARSLAEWSDMVHAYVGRGARLSLEVGLDPQQQDPFLFRTRAEPILSANWTRLLVDAKTTIDDTADADFCATWVDFLHSGAVGADPLWGVITDDNITIQTSLDKGLRRPFTVSVPEGRRYLRSYSWVTICPESLAVKLDQRVLNFFRIQTLEGGGMLLQATPTLFQYDEEAMRRVFKALAPILPKGKPRVFPGYEDLRIVYEDATTQLS